MTLNSWTPSAQEPSDLTADLLDKASQLANQNGDFPKQAPTELLALQPWMQQNQSLWHPKLEPLNTEQLKQLVRFFTLAEERWRWQAGARNPVIWICKILKTRQAFPDKALTQWIKANSTNRYLPYGSLL